jgi:hypothetical protein
MRALTCGLLLASLSALAAPLHDTKNGFSIDVPAGFVRLDEPLVPGALHFFQREQPWSVISIMPFGGTISQRPSDHAIVEASAREAAAKTGTVISRFEYRNVTWKGYTLEVLGTYADASPRGPAVAWATQIPLEKGAVQVQWVGLTADAAKLLPEFDALVASIDGASSWPPPGDAEASRRLGTIAGTVAGLGCIGALAFVAWLLFRKRPVGR